MGEGSSAAQAWLLQSLPSALPPASLPLPVYFLPYLRPPHRARRQHFRAEALPRRPTLWSAFLEVGCLGPTWALVGVPGGRDLCGRGFLERSLASDKVGETGPTE